MSSSWDDLEADEPSKKTDAGLQQYIASSNQRLEERVVKLLMLHGNMADQHRELVRDRAAATGKLGGVSFETFQRRGGARFPTFLHCRHVPYVGQVTHEQLFKGFKRLSSEWLKAAGKTPDDWGRAPVGLVFEWQHAGGQLKIVHNHYIRSETVNGFQMRWPIELPNGKTDLLILENLPDYLANINWSIAKGDVS